MEKRCPSCGKIEESDYKFINNFCQNCFGKNFEIAKLPLSIEVTRCAVCGRIKSGHDWIDENKRSLSELILRNLKSQYSCELKKLALKPGRSNAFKMNMQVDCKVGNVSMSRDFEAMLLFNQTQCIECSREQGGYYDTILQLRSIDPDDPYPAEKMEAKIKKLDKLINERGGYIRKTEKTETGFDVYVAGITPSMQASHIISDDVKHTRKLIGRKNGKDLYRHTFCVRL